jgi:hypothetical protein
LSTTDIDWAQLFTESHPRPGADETTLDRFVAELGKPLSDQEVQVAERSQSNPFPPAHLLHDSYRPFDLRKWRLPGRPPPPSYLSFLRWSDGGTFVNGGRRFDPLFACAEWRYVLLGYRLPEYMPGAFPFALDGGGCFYLFDMREEPVRGEYPVLYVGAGKLCYEDAVLAAASFVDACRGNTDLANDVG